MVHLSPQFPSAWNEASIETPHFSYIWKREPTAVTLHWKSPVVTAVHLRLPLAAARIDQVAVDGKPMPWRIEPGVMISWLMVEITPGLEGTVSITYLPAVRSVPDEIECHEGGELRLNLVDYQATQLLDPQQVLGSPVVADAIVRGKVVGEPGPRLLFLQGGTEICPVFIPLRVRIVPSEATVEGVWSAPKLPSQDLGYWSLIDLGNSFNASITDVLPRVATSAQPPAAPALGVNHAYWKDHLTSRVSGKKPLGRSVAGEDRPG